MTGTVFFDTSVLVSGLASVGPPSDHSRRLLVAVAQDRISRRATAWHCCLEFYSVVTRLPEEYRLTQPLALDLLQTQILARFQVHSLPEASRAEFVDSLSREGIAGGRIYDLHIAEIARASGAGTIVTNNRRHFTGLLRYGIRVLTASELVEEMGA